MLENISVCCISAMFCEGNFEEVHAMQVKVTPVWKLARHVRKVNENERPKTSLHTFADFYYVKMGPQRESESVFGAFA